MLVRYSSRYEQGARCYGRRVPPDGVLEGPSFLKDLDPLNTLYRVVYPFLRSQDRRTEQEICQSGSGFITINIY